jgi:hypothetical protein
MKLIPLALVAVMSSGTAPAAGVTAVSSGYWWEAESGVAAAPAPPNVPDGGLYVASSPSGPTAVSAVTFTLAADEGNPQLVLKVHSLDKGDTFAVDAYPTTSTWKAGSAQPWSNRPVPAAKAAPVHGVVSADATTVTFALTDVTPGSSADIVIVPGAPAPVAAGAPVPPAPTFDASFEPVTATSVLTTRLQSPAYGAPAEQAAAPDLSVPLAPAAAPALGAPLVPTTQPTSAPALAPSIAPAQPLTSPRQAAATSAQPAGRTARETALLVALLAGTTFYLGWLARGQSTGIPGRLSLYDLPPPTAEEAA